MHGLLLIILVTLGTVLIVPFAFVFAWFFMILIPVIMLFLLPLITFGLFFVARVFAATGCKCRVLIVDADELMISPLVTLLKSKGAEVVCVSSYRAMKEKLKAASFQAVFFDALEPDIDKGEVLSEVDASLRLKRKVPLIYYTDQVDFSVTPHLKNFKVIDQWNKFDLTSLEERVNKSMDTVLKAA